MHEVDSEVSLLVFRLFQIDPETLFERFQLLYPQLNETAQDTAGNPSIGKAEIVNLYTQQYG